MKHITGYVLSLIVFSGTLQAEGWTVSIGAGWNGNLTESSMPWEDGGGVAGYFQLKKTYPLSDNLYVAYHYLHLSQINVGPPFNDKAESSVDHIGVAIEWKF